METKNGETELALGREIGALISFARRTPGFKWSKAAANVFLWHTNSPPMTFDAAHPRRPNERGSQFSPPPQRCSAKNTPQQR